MNDVFNEVYVDIDQTPRVHQRTRLGMSVSVLDLSIENDVSYLNNQSDKQDPRIGRAVSEVDLSLYDEENIGLQVSWSSPSLGHSADRLGGIEHARRCRAGGTGNITGAVPFFNNWRGR